MLKENYVNKQNNMSELIRISKSKRYTLETCPKLSKRMLFSNTYLDNGGYFQEIEDLEEYCKDNDIEMPTYIWGTASNDITLDAYEIVSNALEDSYEDAFDNVDMEELKKLQQACDNFIKVHGDCLKTYYADYNVCIILE